MGNGNGDGRPTADQAKTLVVRCTTGMMEQMYMLCKTALEGVYFPDSSGEKGRKVLDHI